MKKQDNVEMAKAKELRVGKDVRDVINQSGFPLQIATKHVVEKTCDDWSVLYTEHAWTNQDTGGSGFIDLVLEYSGGRIVVVVECKRVLETSWIFLNEKDSAPRRHATAWHSTKQEWVSVAMNPSSFESLFCIVDGQDPKARPMIERIGAELVEATEALGDMEYGLPSCREIDPRLYLSLVVTTATLKVCHVDPARIALEDGRASDVEECEVPYVRLRKQLSQRAAEVGNAFLYDDRQRAAKGKERTVFVVNARYLKDFLQQVQLDPL